MVATNAKHLRRIVTSAVLACSGLFVATLLGVGCAANVADTGGADYGVVQQPEQRAARSCRTPACELAQKQYPTCVRVCTAELERTGAPDAGDPLAACEARCDGLPDPLCERGISSDSVCCAASCGNCGGLGCSRRPGGKDDCCVLHIQSAGQSCLHQDAPCAL